MGHFSLTVFSRFFANISLASVLFFRWQIESGRGSEKNAIENVTRTATAYEACKPASHVFAAYWATSWIKNSITGAVLSRVVLPLGKQAIETMTTDHSAAALFSMAFVTAPNEDVAKTIARGLVQNKLAACVNIIPKVTSIYEWQDKMNEDSEVLMMIKTRTSRMEELTQFVKSNHPYDVCEVISTHIFQGNQPYLDWIGQIVPEKPVSSV